MVEPQTAKAIARARPWNIAFKVESVAGRMAAAPTPWTSRRRTALLEAAAGLLAEQGTGAVTLAAVGAAAGLARSSVYQYFDSTPALLASVVEELASRANDRLAEAGVHESTPRARIDAFVRAALDTALDATHRSLMSLDSVTLPRECRVHVEELHRRQFEPLRAALEELGDPDPPLTADLIRGILGAASRSLGEGVPRDAVVRRTLHLVHHGIA